MKKTSLVLAIILVMVFSVAAGASQTITMGTAKYLEDVMDQFKTLVEKYTNGEVQVKNLKAPVFEDEVGNITLLQNGDMTATVVGINKLGVSPSMGFVSWIQVRHPCPPER